jgi:hypothetical protein
MTEERCAHGWPRPAYSRDATTATSVEQQRVKAKLLSAESRSEGYPQSDRILDDFSGGRATETLRATIDCLPEVVDAVGQRIPVFSAPLSSATTRAWAQQLVASHDTVPTSAKDFLPRAARAGDDGGRGPDAS